MPTQSPMNPHPSVCSAAQTAALLPWRDLMQALAQAAADMQAGAIQAPARQVVPYPGAGVLLSMPATAADIGVHKLVNVFAENRAQGLPTINGVVSVSDGRTGVIRLILDGPTVTLRRTVAVSMLGLSRLWPQGPRHVVVFGTGAQAMGHVAALKALHPAAQVYVVGRTLAQAEQFVQACGHPRAVAVDQVGAEADLVITATTSATPVYDMPARPGRHVIAVGAYREDLAEIGPRTLHGSQLYVDDVEGARHEAGDYLQAGIDWATVRPLTDLLADRSPSGPVVFKTVGCAAWDLAAARCALAHQPLS